MYGISIWENLIEGKKERRGNRVLEGDPRFSLVILVGEDTEQQPEEPRVVDTEHDPPDHRRRSSPWPRVVVVVIPIVHLVPQGERDMAKQAMSKGEQKKTTNNWPQKKKNRSDNKRLTGIFSWRDKRISSVRDCAQVEDNYIPISTTTQSGNFLENDEKIQSK